MTQDHECWKHETLYKTIKKTITLGKRDVEVTTYVYQCKICKKQREA